MKEILKVTVCGGGNGAQALVPIAASNLGIMVDIYTPFGDEALRLQSAIEATGAVQASASPHRASADPADVVPGSELVVLVLPAFAHESILHQVVPYLDRGAWVGVIPARGGFDYAAKQVLFENNREDVVIFGLQTLPWACRIREYGRHVQILGVKNSVDAACLPAHRIKQLTPRLSQLLGLPVESAASMLALTLANTGQLIHPGIMYGLFSQWDGNPFADVPLFYHSLNKEGARILEEMDVEVQSIWDKLAYALDLSAVRPLKSWLLRSYGDLIADPSTLYSAFRTNQAYAGLAAPVKEITPGEYIPDYTARYLVEDVPFGLAVTRAIAQLAGVGTPTIDRVISWAGAQLDKDYLGRDAAETRIPQNYGLSSLEKLIEFTTISNRN
ncbi:MAG: NAD/NADP octopine/nopaline dehydrogenase family protein [Anaerolineales bacterium]|nr:NAD/NADP octopine/nopaline dehydrogenase family protein [Anaerolineales bacterium]